MWPEALKIWAVVAGSRAASDYTEGNDSAPFVPVEDAMFVRSWPARSRKRPSIAGGIDSQTTGLTPELEPAESPHIAKPRTAGAFGHPFQPADPASPAQELALQPNTRKGKHMDTVKDVCVIVPTVLLTAAAVIGVATVISLGSWALL